MKIGIIGNGYFGQKVYKIIKNIENIKIIFFCSKNYINYIDIDIDWIFIISSTSSHYELSKLYLNKGINVFCEKPPTYSYKQTTELINLAKKNNCKFYVSDLYNYDETNKIYKYILSENKIININWEKYGSFKDTILNNLVWHDLYLLYPYINDKEIKIHKNISERFKLKFMFTFNDKIINFYYNVNNKDICEKKINAIILNYNENNLTSMFKKILFNNIDYINHFNMVLWCSKLLENIKKICYKTISVIGGGIFGCTMAYKLAQYGFNVKLIEKKEDIFMCATGINQYRLHKGYHYPRCIKTALSTLGGVKTFLNEFNDCIVNKSIKHYYAISNKNSKVNRREYLTFLNKTKLDYTIIESHFLNNVDLMIKCNEDLINIDKLKKKVLDKLNLFNVEIILNKEIKTLTDKINIVATYANLNYLLKDKQKFKFQLCEKIIFLLPSQYKNISVVIMDGPFMCIDPFGDSELHVMGNVIHCEHHSNIGYYPIIPEKYKRVLNNGIITDFEFSKKNEFIKSAMHFFPGIENSKYIGSMFTIRTTLSNVENTDSRPSIILSDKDKLNYFIFSGKICTCVDISTEIINKLEKLLI